jgi:WD40 repeat protein
MYANDSQQQLFATLMILLALATAPLVVAGEGTAPQQQTQAAASPRVDQFGDPLPAGAIARLGSNRFRTPDVVNSLAFSPDDRTLMAHCDGQVLVWARDSGKEVRRFSVPPEQISSFSPDGRALALFDGERLRLWDTARGKELRKWDFPKGWNRFPPVISADGTCLAVGVDNSVLLYDCTSDKPPKLLEFDATIETLAFSPDGRRLAVALRDSPVQLWDLSTRKHVRDLGNKFAFHLAGLCFSPDGKCLACRTLAGVTLLDIATGKARAQLQPYFGESPLLFNSDGSGLIASDASGVQLFDRTLHKKVDFSTDYLDRPIPALSRDGKTLAVGGRQGEYRQIRLWDLTQARQRPVEAGHSIRLNLLQFSADGKTLVTGDPQKLLFWDTESGWRRRETHGNDLSEPLLSADLGRLARVWADSISLWDLTGATKRTELNYGGKDCIRHAAFSPDGKYLVTAHNRRDRDGGGEASGDNGLHIWDLGTGKEIRSMSTSRAGLYGLLRLTPDGTRAITASIGGQISDRYTFEDWSKGGPIYLWDLRLGKEVMTLEGHQGAALSLGVSADSRLLASAGYDKTVRLWELASGKTVFKLTTGPNWLQRMAFSPDGRLLAAPCLSHDKPCPIGLWDLTTGMEVHRFKGHRADFEFLAISPDGSRLASGLENGTVLIWDLAPVQKAIRRGPAKLRTDDRPRRWADLASLDALQAYRAVWALTDCGDQAVDLIQQHLRPARTDARRLKELIANLDSRSFAIRQAAVRELEQLGELAEPALRHVLATGPSLEARRRIEPLLDYQRLHLNPETLRRIRAVWVLENIRTSRARKVLQALASGEATARLTQEAANALKRLK